MLDTVPSFKVDTMTTEEFPVQDHRLLIGVDELPDVSGLVSTPFALPTGTVTFLLTDVEGSTQAWQRHPDTMPAAISTHYEILDRVIGRWGGVRPIEQGEGDSVVGAFVRPSARWRRRLRPSVSSRPRSGRAALS